MFTPSIHFREKGLFQSLLFIVIVVIRVKEPRATVLDFYTDALSVAIDIAVVASMPSFSAVALAFRLAISASLFTLRPTTRTLFDVFQPTMR